MIKSTTNYDMFKLHASNRKLKINDIERLKQSISTVNLLHLNPIIVSKEMQIIDGQHRLQSAKDLKLPIYYMVSESSEAIHMAILNAAQKKWMLEDYLHFFSTEGYEEYIKLNTFLTKNNLELIDFSRFLRMGSRGTHYKKLTQDFKRGSFKCPKQEVFDSYLQVTDWVKQIQSFITDRNSNCYKVVGAANFNRALFALLSSKNVDFEELMKKIELKIDTIGPRSGTGGYYQMFLQIYNFRRHNVIDIPLGAINEE